MPKPGEPPEQVDLAALQALFPHHMRRAIEQRFVRSNGLALFEGGAAFPTRVLVSCGPGKDIPDIDALQMGAAYGSGVDRLRLRLICKNPARGPIFGAASEEPRVGVEEGNVG